MTDDSRIEAGRDGSTSFIGADATMLYQATVLKSAIKLYVGSGIKANRAYTPTNMLATAGRITGKSYKRGQLPQAQADLEQWVLAMRAALPVVQS